MVGAEGIEPPTSAMYGQCSATELYACTSPRGPLLVPYPTICIIRPTLEIGFSWLNCMRANDFLLGLALVELILAASAGTAPAMPLLSRLEVPQSSGASPVVRTTPSVPAVDPIIDLSAAGEVAGTAPPSALDIDRPRPAPRAGGEPALGDPPRHPHASGGKLPRPSRRNNPTFTRTDAGGAQSGGAAGHGAPAAG